MSQQAPFSDEGYLLMGAAFEVHNILGGVSTGILIR